MARSYQFVKVFYLITTLSLLAFFLILLKDATTHNEEIDVNTRYFLLGGADFDKKLPNDMKYLLRWTGDGSALSYMGNGRQGFIEKKCPVSNCYVTSNRNYFEDYTKFDAFLFAGSQVVHMNPNNFPTHRSPHQKYIFATFESSDNYPACNSHLDGFFNLTWTYKLDSDARWGYVVIRNSKGDIIGPNTDMHWNETMTPINDTFRNILKSKKKAAAWFVSNCQSRSGREKFVQEVKKYLVPLGLTVDIYGTCGPLKCPRNQMDQCLEKLEKEYYFYFSFENSMTEDYVTEKLLHALQHNTVPVVFGGANYTRFMPEGIYLNAVSLGPEKLAQTMNDIIQDPERYYDFFKYKGHYSFHRRVESVETDDYCNICALLNDEEFVKMKTVYEHFREWWNPKSHRRC